MDAGHADRGDVSSGQVRAAGHEHDITATAGHAIWTNDRPSDDGALWTPTRDLASGAWLRTSSGTWIQTTAVQAFTTETNTYNLTVAHDHNYHVVAGASDALVHNDGASCDMGDGGYLYRGVPEGHPGYEDAANGTARPRGGHSDPARHNGGNTQSVYTSWSTNLDEVALDAASEGNGPGIVLRIPNQDTLGYMRVDSPDIYGESEVLIEGVVTGALRSVGGGKWH